MRAIVCVAGVELPELSLSHGPVGSVLGFDHAPYDERVRSRWHELLYPYPLRAYKHRYVQRCTRIESNRIESDPSTSFSRLFVSFLPKHVREVRSSSRTKNVDVWYYEHLATALTVPLRARASIKEPLPFVVSLPFPSLPFPSLPCPFPSRHLDPDPTGC